MVQAHPRARILVAGQAPGRRVHASGVPFDDPSGDRLRDWMGVSRATFYDARRVAILPMGFCYPGTGASGDLPPRPECAPAWREELLAHLTSVRLTLVLGRHALAYHVPGSPRRLRDAVAEGPGPGGRVFVLPHPSPRNNGWLARHPWFERELVPRLRERVRSVLARDTRETPDSDPKPG